MDLGPWTPSAQVIVNLDQRVPGNDGIVHVNAVWMPLLICSLPRPHVILNRFEAEVAKSNQIHSFRQFVLRVTVLETYAIPICFLTSDKAADSSPFCRVVLVVQPRDGRPEKITRSREYVFNPSNLDVVEVHVLRGKRFETKGVRYSHLKQYISLQE